MKTNSKRTLRFEGLESRELMAGNVWAGVQGNSLRVSGGDGPETVQISQVGGGQYRVTGLHGTTINGRSSVIASGITGDIIVNGNGGDDFIFITGASNTSRMVAPNNVFAYGGNGNDQIVVRNVNANGNVLVEGGTGNDALFVENTWAKRDMNINTSWNLNLGYDSNQVVVNNVYVGNPDPHRRHHGRLQILGNAGTDQVWLNQAAVDSLYTYLGGGDDYLSVRNSSLRAASTIDGNLGHNTLNWFNNTGRANTFNFQRRV
jgi:hypothetical protein